MTIPGGILPGDLLIAVVSLHRSAAITRSYTAGWNYLQQAGAISWLQQFDVIYKTSDGTETSLVCTTNLQHQSSWVIYVIRGWSNIEGSAAAKHGVPNQNIIPTALSPSWGAKKTLWIAVMGQYSLEKAQTLISGFTGLIQDSSINGGTDQPRTVCCHKFEEIATQTPGTFGTLSASGGGTAALTIGVLG